MAASEDRPTVIPRIFTADVAGVTGFMRTVLGATGEAAGDRPVEMHVGRSIVMVSDGGGVRDALAAYLYVYVPDIDETYRRAVAAGAAVIEGPVNLPYGDRRATVKDSWGNTWQIATPQR